ncbi:glutathione S-transferase family protein [Devosia lacusdianchii]|uniref:glutathione S-transferase family protein n=1 Tax=Devosia lacusdianchii TaxID=2917991 RepID=UPI001F0529E6|nr:glutathione S-transferase family protein [Devosia sp. JXJ CY 41]
MTDLTLYYTHNLNPRVAVAAARHLALPMRYVRFEPMGADREACRPMNPNTLAPILVENGNSLWETDAIVLRLAKLADSGFWPDEHAAAIMQWVSWSAHHFTRAGDTFYFENIIVRRYMDRAPDQRALASAEDDFHRLARILDNVLAQRDWLVGGGLTYADFRVATVLPFAGPALLPVVGYENIVKWHGRLNELAAWREPFAGLDERALPLAGQTNKLPLAGVTA